MSDKEYYDISDKYGLPRKYVSCPLCGKIYGAYGRKVCFNCNECSKCCECKEPDHVKAEEFIAEYIDYM